MKSTTDNCLISIFIPVYNGSKYLKKSIDSVLNQTFKDYELVCVDDTSTDDSFEILNNYAKKDSRIKILQKPNGGNVPKSWNFVMPYLKGESITYMSQDDMMSEDNLEQMYIRQQETGADCVLPDLQDYYEAKKEGKKMVGFNGNRDLILTNKEALEFSLNWGIHGFALWKSKLLKNEQFPEDSFNSDEYITRKLFLKSNKIAFCKGIFYRRQDNEKAITKTYGLKNYYSILTNFRIYKLLEENDFEPSIVLSHLYVIYPLYFRQYRLLMHRKEINADSDFKKIQLMLYELYLKLNKEKLLNLNKHYNQINKVKIYFIWILFCNYHIFKMTMSLVFLFDKIKESVTNNKSRLFLSTCY